MFMLMQYEKKWEDLQAYKKEIIECFISKIYLFDDKLITYYNIDETQQELKSSDISLVESDGFDQRKLCSIIKKP